MLSNGASLYRVFHVKEPIKKRYISACRKGGVILKTVSKRSFGPILLCKFCVTQVVWPPQSTVEILDF